MSDRYCAIVQGRMGSIRLPGKVLKKVLGRPLLSFLVERLKAVTLIDDYVIATTIERDDDAIAEFCTDHNVPFFRGSESDVLKRFYDVATERKADHIVRITADCPIIDPSIIDDVVRKHKESQCDYVTNAIDSTYPDGMDVEVFTFEALERSYNEAKLLSEREHVTPYIHTNTDQFQVSYVRGEENYSHLRLTVDHPEDFDLVKSIIERLYPQNPAFDLQDILRLLCDEPDLVKINANYTRNEGYEESKNEDRNVD